MGPGQIDIIDKKDPKNIKTQHAWFQKELIFDRDNGRDRMWLKENARFVDEGPANDPTVGPTTLEGDEIKVWLEAQEPTPAGPSHPGYDTGRRQTGRAGGFYRSTTAPCRSHRQRQGRTART